MSPKASTGLFWNTAHCQFSVAVFTGISRRIFERSSGKYCQLVGGCRSRQRRRRRRGQRKRSSGGCASWRLSTAPRCSAWSAASRRPTSSPSSRWASLSVLFGTIRRPGTKLVHDVGPGDHIERPNTQCHIRLNYSSALLWLPSPLHHRDLSGTHAIECYSIHRSGMLFSAGQAAFLYGPISGV